MKQRDEVFVHHCQMCQRERQITVRIEREYGDFGSIISSWPEFDLEPLCKGWTDDELPRFIEDIKDVGLELRDNIERYIERCAERCPFHPASDYGGSDPDTAWVLGRRQERGLNLKSMKSEGDEALSV